MTMMRFCLLLAAVATLVGQAGCGAKKKEITDLERKQAALLASEAQFAMNLRNWAEAEAALAKVVEKVPDTGAYWVSLGAMRIRLGKRGEAKSAYEGALRAFEAEAQAKETKADPEPWLQQVYVLGLLGRTDAARTMLDKTAKQFPDHRNVKLFVEGKQFDQMLADPRFKEMALP
jgi:tetratricopeptide (TPR) repeat protein